MTPEDHLQIECVKWFRYHYPDLRKMMFHPANGGKRQSRLNKYGKRYSPEAQKFEKMGVVSGVSDLILLVQRHGYGSLCIELKTKTGKQTPLQHEWELSALSHGNKYVLCRSFDEFQKEVTKYLEL